MILFEKIIVCELLPNIDHIGEVNTVKCIGTYARTPGLHIVWARRSAYTKSKY
jgi:hypothetical protein